MEKFSEYLLPVLALTVLTAGWAIVQLIAQKTGTKNHIDNHEGCCGACDKKDSCTKAETL